MAKKYILWKVPYLWLLVNIPFRYKVKNVDNECQISFKIFVLLALIMCFRECLSNWLLTLKMISKLGKYS